MRQRADTRVAYDTCCEPVPALRLVSFAGQTAHTSQRTATPAGKPEGQVWRVSRVRRTKLVKLVSYMILSRVEDKLLPRD